MLFARKNPFFSKHANLAPFSLPTKPPSLLMNPQPWHPALCPQTPHCAHNLQPWHHALYPKHSIWPTTHNFGAMLSAHNHTKIFLSSHNFYPILLAPHKHGTILSVRTDTTLLSKSPGLIIWKQMYRYFAQPKN